MSKDLSKKAQEELITLFRKAAITHGKATLSGNYKKGNKAFVEVDNVYEEMKSRNILPVALIKLLSDENISVKTFAATRLLPFVPEQAKLTLQEISNSEKSILGFDAKMVLIQLEKGELSFR